MYKSANNFMGLSIIGIISFECLKLPLGYT